MSRGTGVEMSGLSGGNLGFGDREMRGEARS